MRTEVSGGAGQTLCSHQHLYFNSKTLQIWTFPLLDLPLTPLTGAPHQGVRRAQRDSEEHLDSEALPASHQSRVFGHLEEGSSLSNEIGGRVKLGYLSLVQHQNPRRDRVVMTFLESTLALLKAHMCLNSYLNSLNNIRIHSSCLDDKKVSVSKYLSWDSDTTAGFCTQWYTDRKHLKYLSVWVIHVLFYRLCTSAHSIVKKTMDTN